MNRESANRLQTSPPPPAYDSTTLEARDAFRKHQEHIAQKAELRAKQSRLRERLRELTAQFDSQDEPFAAAVALLAEFTAGVEERLELLDDRLDSFEEAILEGLARAEEDADR